MLRFHSTRLLSLPACEKLSTNSSATHRRGDSLLVTAIDGMLSVDLRQPLAISILFHGTRIASWAAPPELGLGLSGMNQPLPYLLLALPPLSPCGTDERRSRYEASSPSSNCDGSSCTSSDQQHISNPLLLRFGSSSPLRYPPLLPRQQQLIACNFVTLQPSNNQPLSPQRTQEGRLDGGGSSGTWDRWENRSSERERRRLGVTGLRKASAHMTRRGRVVHVPT